ncbi:hypothetical protein ABFS82_02G096400 [Erythranthe guttata]|uniref:uncharacterized protein LOC105976361 n=1 Tax=Erythranthe guttata TaxID=4155 RepID=UPI00064DB7D9|nr:PREDICTED: uncharacterized protein LOC105976361 [Erythranthe guttata]|eukprot:XP_012857082.1 PREDICTED: uncharacterized protein LOC105976361 [Erythranthe guttata]
MYLVDAGIGRPRIANKQELIKPPKSSRVGFLTPSNRETPSCSSAASSIWSPAIPGPSSRPPPGSTNDAAASGGEQRFRKQRAWVELKNTWRSNSKVRGGYAVAVAGQIAFLPARPSDRFIIESITPKNFVVAKA